MGQIKVSVLEVDGVELSGATEYDLASAINHVSQLGMFATNNVNSTTSFTSYSTKATLVTPDLPFGDYIVFANYKYDKESSSSNATVRLLDGTTVLTVSEVSKGSSDSTPYCIVQVLTGISGVHTLKLDFKSGNLNQTGSLLTEATRISQTTIVLWRVK